MKIRNRKFEINKYHQSVAFLESLMNLPNGFKKNGRSYYIKRLAFLLKLLGNPHHGFKYIHIAGTAGKGTTVNLIHEMIQNAGYKVGSYFSPHTTTSIERIKVNDLYISPSDFAKLMDKIKPALTQCAIKCPFGQPSYFETFLALAFLYFKQQKCEYVVLEAGLGGQFDATNIIPKPLITAITNINYDHQEILGQTLKMIAKDKSGIIKNGSVFITTEQRPELLKLFQNKCQRVGAKYYGRMAPSADLNKSLAQIIGELLKLPKNAIVQGLKNAKLPCRFEMVQKKPLIILDGAHNPAKINKLAEKLKNLSYRRLIIIIGMADDKDHKQTLAKIIPLTDEIILTRFLNPFRKTAGLNELLTITNGIARKKRPISQFSDPWQALNFGLGRQNTNDCLLITGSFFLAGELRKKWIREEIILQRRKSF